MSLQNLKEEAKIVWKSWEMPEGFNPPAKPEGYIEEATKFLTQLVERVGLEIHPPNRKMNTFLAHVGAKHAEEKGLAEKYRSAIFEAIWKYGKDIEERTTLISIAKEIGLDSQEYTKALEDPKYISMVKADLESSIQNEIWTIPSYLGSHGEIQVHHFKDIPSEDELRKIL